MLKYARDENSKQSQWISQMLHSYPVFNLRVFLFLHGELSTIFVHNKFPLIGECHRLVWEIVMHVIWYWFQQNIRYLQELHERKEAKHHIQEDKKRFDLERIMIHLSKGTGGRNAVAGQHSNWSVWRMQRITARETTNEAINISNRWSSTKNFDRMARRIIPEQGRS